MDIFSSIIISIVEGITEFLPISSTGHMIIVSDWLNLGQGDKLKAFEVMIQLAAILAIVWIYRSRVNFQNRILWSKLFVAFLPVGLVGFLFADFFKSLFSIKVVAFTFIIGGIVLLFTEKMSEKTIREDIRSIDDIGFLDSVKIGLFQVLALFPGMSRSAMTIIGGIFVGAGRKISGEFAFLLGVPVMSAAFGYDLLKNYSIFNAGDFYILALGFIIAFFSTYFSVKLFLSFLERFTLFGFGIYRIIFGIIPLLFFV